jgi:hypothetical protein
MKPYLFNWTLFDWWRKQAREREEWQMENQTKIIEIFYIFLFAITVNLVANSCIEHNLNRKRNELSKKQKI